MIVRFFLMHSRAQNETSFAADAPARETPNCTPTRLKKSLMPARLSILRTATESCAPLKVDSTAGCIGVQCCGRGFVNSTPHLARIYTHDFFSRVAQAHIALFFMRCFPTWPSSCAHVMFRTLLDPATDFTNSEHSYLIFSFVPFMLAYHFHSATWTLFWPFWSTSDRLKTQATT